MGWRILISEKGKNDYTPITKKFVSRDKRKVGSEVIDWMCRNGFITPNQLAGKALFQDLDSFKAANGSKKITFTIELVDKEDEAK